MNRVKSFEKPLMQCPACKKFVPCINLARNYGYCNKGCWMKHGSPSVEKMEFKQLKKDFKNWLFTYHMENTIYRSRKLPTVKYKNLEGRISAWCDDIREDIINWEDHFYPVLRKYVGLSD
jgi:hypothetical protein